MPCCSSLSRPCCTIASSTRAPRMMMAGRMRRTMIESKIFLAQMAFAKSISHQCTESSTMMLKLSLTVEKWAFDVGYIFFQWHHHAQHRFGECAGEKYLFRVLFCRHILTCICLQHNDDRKMKLKDFVRSNTNHRKNIPWGYLEGIYMYENQLVASLRKSLRAHIPQCLLQLLNIYGLFTRNHYL